ncbi:MAG: vancomycin high temperature exclusion protein [Candidatus Kapaibacterium sp.]
MAAIAAVALLLAACNYIIEIYSEEYVSDTLDMLPHSKTALVLGTSKYLSDGRENLFFRNRIKAASQLYHRGKVDYLIVSGDNSSIHYNEPITMYRELISQGIPDSVIYADYAGFRTLDAVVRAREIFGQDTIIIISQKFHNKRAVYIARNKNISAWGYNAEEVNIYNSFSTLMREFFARVKVFIDLYITNEQPRFLGERIYIGESK